MENKTMFPREFIIWKEKHITINQGTNTPYWITRLNKWVTLDELYQYWINEIKRRNQK